MNNQMRKFNWISSTNGDVNALNVLNERMSAFYARPELRDSYQNMLQSGDGTAPAEGTAAESLIRYIMTNHFERVLEVGCGNGRLYRQIAHAGYNGRYSGIEVANHIIQGNTSTYPDGDWRCSSAYQIPFEDNSFDFCFCFYVLEHLVFPERALHEMLRTVKPGGQLAIIFPDFVAAKQFDSQWCGISPGSARSKLRVFKLIDGAITLVDSRVRLRYALKDAAKTYGPFPVNLQPICLYARELMWPDIDAVYIASKDEIHAWAGQRQISVSYPSGSDGYFSRNAFMILAKP